MVFRFLSQSRLRNLKWISWDHREPTPFLRVKVFDTETKWWPTFGPCPSPKRMRQLSIGFIYCKRAPCRSPFDPPLFRKERRWIHTLVILIGWICRSLKLFWASMCWLSRFYWPAFPIWSIDLGLRSIILVCGRKWLLYGKRGENSGGFDTF